MSDYKRTGKEYARKNRKKLNENSKLWRQKNYEHYIEYKRKYKVANADKIFDQTLRLTYGITLTDYNDMLMKQDCRCAICGAPQVRLDRRLSVDHNHITKRVRGLLCQMCNSGLGHFKDSKEILLNAVNYLKE